MNTTAEEALQLRDIHLPPAPDFWPPAPGWWLLGLLLLSLALWAGIVLWRRYQRHRQQQRLLQLLARLERNGQQQPQQLLAQLSILLRRIALLYFPRKRVAGLTGTAWLEFLDSSGGNGGFSHGPGRVLADGPYMRRLPEPVDGQALGTLIRNWIRTNTGA